MFRILKFELYKIFSKKSLIVIACLFFVVLMLINFQSFDSFKSQYGSPRTLYNNFYKGKEGDISLSLRKKADKFFDKYDEEQNAEDKKLDRISFNSLCLYYGDVNASVNFSVERKNYAKKVTAVTENRLKTYGEDSYEYKYSRLHSNLLNAQKDTGIYYDKGWEKLEGNVVFLIVIALVLLGLTPIFASEYSNKTDSLILTSKRGKGSVITAKILAAIIYSAAVSIFFNLANLLSLGIPFGFNGASAAHPYGFSTFDQIFMFTNLEHFLVKAGVMTIGAVFLAMLVLLLSVLFKNQLVTFFVSGFVVGLPTLFSSMQSTLKFDENVNHFINSILYFSYGRILRGDSMFMNFKAYNIFGTPVLSYIVVLTVFFMVSVLFVGLIYPAFKKHQVS